MPIAESEVVRPADADRSVPVPLERLPAALIRHVDLCHELAQVELAERVTRAERHRLGRDAPAPVRLVPDDDPRRAVRVLPIDAVDARRADGLAVRLDHPDDIGLRLPSLLE